ncbi:MAG: adenosine deaminase [Xanthomonadales bacterium]|nr:adenosine deaminase [Xanthomonadales bacterium]
MIDPTLPLIDLHRHLDGNVRLDTILELADEHGIELPADTVEGLRPHVQIVGKVAGLMDFIGRFKYLTAVMVDTDAVRRIAYENLLDAAREGIDYVELRFSPWFMAETHGLDPMAVVEAAADGASAGQRDTGVRCNLIGILSRTYGVATAHAELDALIGCADKLVALDLAGDEVNFPAAEFRSHFERARDAGLHVTVHAGEVDGPASVWSAIRDLRAERIGHGIRSHEDPELMDYLAERRIGLEMNLTSNLHVGIFDDYPEHPIQRYLEHGVLVNINTDDPAISGIDLPHEFNVAAPKAGLMNEHLRQIQLNAVEMAFLSDDDRQAMLRRKQ